MIARCRCGRLATWHYMPEWGDEPLDWIRNMCDACVPRGCSCNRIQFSGDDPTEHTDERGRLLPCCEWEEDPYGVDDMADYSDYPVWERIVIEENPDLFNEDGTDRIIDTTGGPT